MLTLYIADVERDAGMKKLSREEAAKVLEGMKVKTEIPKAAVTQWERNAALDMAIEVLNCSEIPNKSDTISRRAAIDAIMGQPPEPHYPSWYAAQIEKLPAVQPDHIADIGKKASISCGHEDDLISRRSAIALAKDICVPTEDGGVYRTRSIDPQEVRELPAVQPEQRWIPVTERLPEKPCYCLTSNEYSNVCEDFYWGEDSFEKANKYHYEVLAWMPLPEPYKGGETE